MCTEEIQVWPSYIHFAVNNCRQTIEINSVSVSVLSAHSFPLKNLFYQSEPQSVWGVLWEHDTSKALTDSREDTKGKTAHFLVRIKPQLTTSPAYSPTKEKRKTISREHRGKWNCLMASLARRWMCANMTPRKPKEPLGNQISPLRETRPTSKEHRMQTKRLQDRLLIGVKVFHKVMEAKRHFKKLHLSVVWWCNQNNDVRRQRIYFPQVSILVYSYIMACRLVLFGNGKYPKNLLVF